MKLVGEPVRRVEDARFLTGRGRYVDDIVLPGTVHAAFVRSPHAAARIVSIETRAAAGLPGVFRVLTGTDWIEAGLGKFAVWSPVKSSDGTERQNMTQPILATECVCYVGQPIALVVAETRAQALDAAEAVEVLFEPRACIVETGRALLPGVPLVHPELGTNEIYSVHVGDEAATVRAFVGAAHVASLELVNTRITANPIEPRALLASYDPGEDGFTLYVTHQAPHLLRRDLADNTLRHPEHRIRVISPDVGGGFGMKMANHPEEPAVLWAAKVVGRPVRWTATRSESLITDAQARDHFTRAQMAFDRTGRILAMNVDTIASLGAFQTRMGASIPAQFYSRTLAGFYRIPSAHCRVTGVHTNAPPVQAYRGAGRPEAIYVLESLIEDGARALGLDPVAIRRLNFIDKTEFPYTSALGLTYDSGNPAGLVEMALAKLDYDAFRKRQTEARATGARELPGIGFACLIDCAGTPSKAMAGFGRKVIGGWDSAAIRIHPDGQVTVLSGAHSHGQGHETAYAQLAAERLGLPLAFVRVVEGDTDKVQFGHGSWGSRSTMTTGVAVAKAADVLHSKCRRIAAHLLECGEGDLEFSDLKFRVVGTDRFVGFAEVVRAAYQGGGLPAGMEPSLEHLAFHDPIERACSSGFQVCAVRVDQETGKISLDRYIAIDDCGRIINPMIVEGQTQGGLAQGIGQALMEQCFYDPSTGQPLSGSFMDYAMPRASDFPSFEIGTQETPSPNNPLGVKGAGESGTIGALAAVRNAVVDALTPLGVRHIDMPLTPPRVWKAIQEARLNPEFLAGQAAK
jgi:carbon-monoxide dehydrogenase large subunit